MRLLLLRIGGTLALTTSFALAALPVAAHPTVEVANPRPQDRLIPGSLVMEGMAFDHDAKEGTGVEQVSIFICPRGEGGQYLGDATLGMPSTMPTPSAQFAAAGWVFKTPALRGAGDERTLCVFARSSVTGTETLVRVPIIIGEQPPRHTESLVGPLASGSGSPTAPGTGGGTITSPGGEEGGPGE